MGFLENIEKREICGICHLKWETLTNYKFRKLVTCNSHPVLLILKAFVWARKNNTCLFVGINMTLCICWESLPSSLDFIVSLTSLSAILSEQELCLPSSSSLVVIFALIAEVLLVNSGRIPFEVTPELFCIIWPRFIGVGLWITEGFDPEGSEKYNHIIIITKLSIYFCSLFLARILMLLNTWVIHKIDSVPNNILRKK